MHASQISTTETVSATLPLKVRVATQSSTVMEGFSLRWHQDILAADASASGPYPMTPKATSRSAAPSEQLKADTNGSKNSSAEMGDPVTPFMRDRSAVSAATPNTAASADARVAERPALEAVVGGTAVHVGAAGSARSRRELKATGRTGFAEVVNPQDTASFTAAVVTTPGVQRNVPATSHSIEVPQNLSNSPSQATSTVPAAIKLSRPSATGLSGKETPAKPGSAVDEVLASGSSNHATAMSAELSRSSAGAGAATSVTSTGTTGSSSHSEGISPIAIVSHLNQAGTLSAVPQTVALNHAVLPSSRTDLHFQATSVADAIGTGPVHVLGSGPAQLDVGVLDGTHGWLRIRAELGAGGSVSASLTARGLADESLRASLPEMVKYLGSEGVSVSSLAVHRFSEDANPMPASTSEGQLNGNAPGHRPGGGEQRDGTGTQKEQSEAADRFSTRSTATTNSLAGLDPADAEVPSGWIHGFSRSTPGLFWPLGALGGGSGSWLNVSA